MQAPLRIEHVGQRRRVKLAGAAAVVEHEQPFRRVAHGIGARARMAGETFFGHIAYGSASAPEMTGLPAGAVQDAPGSRTLLTSADMLVVEAIAGRCLAARCVRMQQPGRLSSVAETSTFAPRDGSDSRGKPFQR